MLSFTENSCFLRHVSKNCLFGRFSGLTCLTWLIFGLKLSNNDSYKVLKDFNKNSISRVLAGSEGRIKIAVFGRFLGLTCLIWLIFGLKLSNNDSYKVLEDFHKNSILRVLAGSKG